MRHASLIAAAIVLAAAAPLAAQQSAGSCRPALDPIPGAFQSDTIFLALDPGYGIKPLAPEIELTALSVIADSLVLPTPMPMPPVIAKTFSFEGGTMLGGTQGMMGEAFVEFNGKGEVKRVGLTQSSLVSRIDDALIAAVKSGVNNGAFMAYEKATRGPGGFVFIELRSIPLPPFREKAAEYVRQPLAGIPLPQNPAPKKGEIAQLPVRVIQVPVVRMTSHASIPGSGPHPAFPLQERQEGQDGFVHVEFVVGGDGRVLPGTFRLANAMTAGYARAVQHAVEGYTFTPAMVDGCGLPERLTYTFTFDVN
ncbi:MAG: hypothetical protein HOQ09_11600 [Gemmatimonadaceae bacterium]|nr:hypothetical protein [Gemmatimonadaceae bacterium]